MKKPLSNKIKKERIKFLEKEVDSLIFYIDSFVIELEDMEEELKNLKKSK